jgi:hypothetical protein
MIKRFWRWTERRLAGHVTLGRLTIYGANAMHWGVNYYTRRWGYVCFRLPLPCFGAWWPLYFYCSPNATPWASTFYLGNRAERRDARRRRERFGHNFDTNSNWKALNELEGYRGEPG